MPKTKVRKSRTRKSRMRKSLRIKRGGTRDKPNRTESKAAKSEHKPIQKTMNRSYYSPPPTPPTDIEDVIGTGTQPLTHKKNTSENTSVLSLTKQYFEGGPSYFRPTSKQVSEFLNTKKTSGNNVPYLFRKDRNRILGEENDTN